MAFANVQDLVTRTTNRKLRAIGAMDCDDIVDVQRIQSALDEACSIIQSKLACEYPSLSAESVVGTSAEGALKSYNLDIAIHILSPDALNSTDTKAKYEAALDWLQSVCDGDSDLPIPTRPKSTRGGIRRAGPKPEATRCQTRGLYG